MRRAVLHVRRIGWRHPEWWTLVIAGVAALALLAMSVRSISGGAHELHHHPTEVGANSLLFTAVHWQLMVTAMMLPLAAPSMRIAAFRSLWRRRHRTILGFVLGYLGVWTLVAIPLAALLLAFPQLTGEWKEVAAGTAFMVAAVWQLTAAKQRAMVACHATRPIAPRGWPADSDAFLFGSVIARSCCVNCGALMIACTLAGHHVVALLTCAAIGYSERNSWRPNRVVAGLSIVILAFVFGPLWPL